MLWHWSNRVKSFSIESIVHMCKDNAARIITWLLPSFDTDAVWNGPETDRYSFSASSLDGHRRTFSFSLASYSFFFRSSGLCYWPRFLMLHRLSRAWFLRRYPTCPIDTCVSKHVDWIREGRTEECLFLIRSNTEHRIFSRDRVSSCSQQSLFNDVFVASPYTEVSIS